MTAKHNSSRQATGITRRDAIRLAAAASAAMTGSGSARFALAQATPSASPVSANGYARPELLVDAAWLNDRHQTGEIVLVAFMPLEDAEQERIPGALQIDWPELEVIDTTDASLDAWQESVETLIGDLGISRESDVVVYDDGTLFAARLWWLLHWLGHERVSILNGGLAAWREAGFGTDSGPIIRTMIKHPPYDGTPNNDVLAQVDEVLAGIDDPDVAIVDARTPAEYAEGHVPGAVNINYPRNAAPEPPAFWKPAGELLAMYDEAGVTPDRFVIPYCTSGVRSAVTFFTLHLLGYERVALFSGSWQEWASYPDAPIVTGDAP